MTTASDIQDRTLKAMKYHHIQVRTTLTYSISGEQDEEFQALAEKLGFKPKHNLFLAKVLADPTDFFNFRQELVDEGYTVRYEKIPMIFNTKIEYMVVVWKKD